MEEQRGSGVGWERVLDWSLDEGVHTSERFAKLWVAVGLAVLLASPVIAWPVDCLAGKAWAGQNGDAVELSVAGLHVTATDARVTSNADATSFAIDLSGDVTAEVFTLANPYRVIVDLPNLSFEMKPAGAQKARGLISAFRYGLFAERKARVVIDTTGPVRIVRADMTRANSGSGVTLKIDLEPMDAGAFGAGTGARRPAQSVAKHSTALAGDKERKPRDESRPTIVIDPGHGGIDPGAVGADNVAEKTIVLSVARHLKSAIENLKNFDVLLTRDSDIFVSLSKRLQFSHEHSADLFISLHADAIEERHFADNIRGATVYTLSERASDAQARLIADKENASDLIAGLEMHDAPGDDQVQSILIDLLKRETANFSNEFSRVLAGQLAKSIEMSRAPQRSAAFKVLKQPHAPSVLVELGYISNPDDQDKMTTEAWQKKTAGAIAAAVQSYFSKRLADKP